MGLVQGMFSKARGFLLWLFGWEEPIRTPEQVLDVNINEMTVTLSRCKIQVAKLLKEQKDLQDKYNRNLNQITHHQREARNCMVRQEEEAAREHVRNKQKFEQYGGQLQKQLASFKSKAEQLVDTVRNLEARLDETKRKKMLLLTQKQCAEAQLLLSGSEQNEGDGPGLKELLTSLEDQVLEKQAKVMVEADLTADVPALAAAGEFQDLEAKKVEEELASLKKRYLAGGASQRDAEEPVSLPGDEQGESPAAPEEPAAGSAGPAPGAGGGGDGGRQRAGDPAAPEEDVIFIK
jgi:phage shock protein A